MAHVSNHGLEVREEFDEGPTVVVVGALDLSTVTTLERSLDRLVAAGEDICLDLRGLAFCDSSGLAALMRGYNRAVARGVRFEIKAASPPVLRRLDVTGLRSLLGPSP